MNNEINMKYYLKILSKVLIIASIALGIFLGYKIAVFYMPFVLAIVVATIIEPVIKLFMNKLKMKRKAATIVSLFIIMFIIGISFTLLISKVVSEATNLVDNINIYYKESYDFGMNLFNEYKEGIIQIPEEIINVAKNSLEAFLNTFKGIVYNFFTRLINTITSIPTMLTYGVITVLAIVFTCFDREYVINQLKKHIPNKWIKKAKEIIDNTCSIAWSYIKAEAKLSGICFILVLIGLIIFDIIGLNVKYTTIMAIFIGFVDLLPLFGAGTVMLPWAAYLYISGNIHLAIAVLALWIVWAVIKQLIEPKVVSKQMGMHPIFTLIGMYTGFKLLGVLGLMIGPIILLVIKSVFGELIERGILKSFFEIE